MWGCHPVKRGADRSESVCSSSVDDPHSQLASEALNHLGGLYNLARWLVRDPVEAEDLVQETYLRALRHANQSVPEPISARGCFRYGGKWARGSARVRAPRRSWRRCPRRVCNTVGRRSSRPDP
ncbi:MAG: hypothetical protein EHM71_06560 [Zetaproteobacteria bacterium]|nr:MAG: hypothetical protein EHM71_06560 [Zetaproteobacteria bacterium]